jgi:hypothetical protein
MNGTKQLIDSLFNGNEDAFIEHFVKSCLFLPKGIVQEKANELLDNIKNNREVPIRYGKNGIKEFFAPNKKALGNKKEKELKNIANNEGLFFKEGNVKVFLDGNGNQSVVNSIKEKTGYIINTFNRDFFNYTLSHIWAKTTHNPYYFSSLWNVVIIPDYLNYIMDKPRDQDKINEKIQELMKAICIELYNPDSMMKDCISVEKPSSIFFELAKKAINKKWINYLGIKNEITEEKLIFNNMLDKIKNLENQDFISELLKIMVQNDILEENLAILTNSQKCNQLFGHYYPILLENKKENTADNKDLKDRYYAKPFFQYNNKEYYVTNDWYGKSPDKVNPRDNRSSFIIWVESLLAE